MTALPMLPAGSERTRLALLAAAIFVLWVALRPYIGIVHDSRLYTLLALRPDHPRLATDLFLQFGSQDRFTLFSPLYRPLIALLGIGRAAMTLTIIAQAVWLGAAYLLAKALVHDAALALAAVAGAVALPNSYGSGFVFSFGEAFVTPRLFAEAATMVALAFVLRERLGVATAAILVGALLHPVMALPGAAIVFIYAAQRSHLIWLGAAGIAAAGLGLVVFGVEPFTRLSLALDPAWLGVVQARTGLAFLRLWAWQDFVVLIGQITLVISAALTLPPPIRRLALTVLGVACAGLALTFVGADLLHIQFVTSLQLWRANWLLGLCGDILLVPLLVVVARDRMAFAPFRLAVFGGAFFLFATPLFGIGYLFAAPLLSVATILAVARRQSGPQPSVLSLPIIAGGLVVALATIVMAVVVARNTPVLNEDPGLLLRRMMLHAAGIGLLVVATMAPQSRLGARWSRVATIGSAGVVAAAAASWDSRSAWTRFVELDAPVSASLQAFVPPLASVYWSSNLELLWFTLRQPSYHSCAQGAGVVFVRATALAFAHRQNSFRFEPVQFAACSRRTDEPAAPLTGTELQRACRREPLLDYIILPDNLAGLWDRRWQSPVRHWQIVLQDNQPSGRILSEFYRYPCAALRGLHLSPDVSSSGGT